MQILMPLPETDAAPVPEKEEEKSLDAEEKAVRLQMLLHGLISQAVRENNVELTRQIRETIVKEMDYQFRVQEEETQKREQIRMEKEEEHFRKLDEALRQYAGRKGRIAVAGGGREAHRQQKEEQKAARKAAAVSRKEAARSRRESRKLMREQERQKQEQERQTREQARQEKRKKK